jgi:hypothetical protein
LQINAILASPSGLQVEALGFVQGDSFASLNLSNAAQFSYLP